MPKRTDSYLSVKNLFSQGMPKNLSEYTDKVNEKFLDTHLGTVEDFSLKNPNDNLVEWFKNYQNRYFNSVLLKDSFLKIDEDGNFGIIRNYRGMSIQNVAFLAPKSIVVTEIETDGSTGTATNSGASQLEAGKCTVFASGGLYNQMKIKLATAAGNTRVALYSDSASAPSTLLSESSSLTAVVGYTTNYAITEVQVNSTTAWMAHNRDTETGMTYEYWSNGSRAYRAFAYGAMPTPFGTPAGTGALSPKCKVSHS